MFIFKDALWLGSTATGAGATAICTEGADEATDDSDDGSRDNRVHRLSRRRVTGTPSARCARSKADLKAVYTTVLVGKQVAWAPLNSSKEGMTK